MAKDDQIIGTSREKHEEKHGKPPWIWRAEWQIDGFEHMANDRESIRKIGKLENHQGKPWSRVPHVSNQ